MFAVPIVTKAIEFPVAPLLAVIVLVALSVPVTAVLPPKYTAPAATYSEYGLVIVMFVPALGAPAMYRVDALV